MVDDDGLQELDESTDWEIDGDELAVNDPEDDSLVVARAEEDSDDGDLDSSETVASILSCTQDMEKNGIIEGIVVIINTNDDDQLLFTTLARNDLIIGTLQTAMMNWFSTQRDLQMYEEGGEESVVD